MPYVIGVDPGKDGGVAALDPAGKIYHLEPMPEDMRQFADFIDQPHWKKNVHVYVEKAQAFQGQGVSSMFKYGDHFGQIQGILIALSIPHTLVPPQTWQKVCFLGTSPKLGPKSRAFEAARRLFPEQSFKVSHRNKCAHDGMVDAILIALFGFRQNSGGAP